MFYTYVLKSRNKKWFYVGSTKDLKERFLRHEQGRVRSTKPFRPLELVYYEAYQSYDLARKREIDLKNNSYQKDNLLKRLEN